jgi:hypothetical protein
MEMPPFPAKHDTQKAQAGKIFGGNFSSEVYALERRKASGAGLN